MGNNYKQTTVRCVIFREKGAWYGAALEFNVVVDGDAPQVVMDLLNQAVRNYFEAAKKNRLDPAVLNQKADADYEKMWARLDDSGHRRRRATPPPANLYGSLLLRPMLPI